ncbi:MAG: hypothetical protein Q9218_008059, partial [Villophora microphyllina]
MSWMSKRQTTRPEDIAYSLLGLFDVYMPLIYGEGSNAFARLQEEIVKSSDDETIFAWTDDSLFVSGMLALSPAAFAKSGDVVTFQDPHVRRSPYSITNFGLAIEANLVKRYRTNEAPATASDLDVLMPIACTRSSERYPLTICLSSAAGKAVRVETQRLEHLRYPLKPCATFRLIYVRSTYQRKTDSRGNYPYKLRWNQTFSEHLIYSGLVPRDSVFEKRLRDGLDCSGNEARGVQWRFDNSFSETLWGSQHHIEDKSFYFVFEHKLDPLDTWKIYVKRHGKHELPSSNETADVLDSYELRHGTTTIPLWNGFRLNAAITIEEDTGQWHRLIDLQLLFPTTGTEK